MSSSVNPKETREDKIRQRAYEIYLARGVQEGDAVSDWLSAETEFEESDESRGPKKIRAASASL